MPVYDYECCQCGHIHEAIAGYDEQTRNCPECEIGTASRIISQTGQYCGNQDATWLKTAPVNAVDPESRDPVDREFLRNPTRDNRRRWMQHHGKIEYEPGMSLKPDPTDMSKVHKKVWERHQRRNALEIRRR